MPPRKIRLKIEDPNKGGGNFEIDLYKNNSSIVSPPANVVKHSKLCCFNQLNLVIHPRINIDEIPIS